MDKIISCEFNIDTVCVEVKYADGSMLSIVCTNIYQTPCYSVENFYTTIDSFSRIINREFGINSIEDDFAGCVADYCHNDFFLRI